MPDDPPRDLVARVEALEAWAARSSSWAAVDESDDFWALRELEERLAGIPGGGIVFAGRVEMGGGEYAWQLGRSADAVVEIATGDAESATGRLAALGSPIRLRLLLAVLRGTTANADLAELPGLGTTGQVYHHLRALTAAGWLRGAGRGRVTVPAERVVPLITILAAAMG